MRYDRPEKGQLYKLVEPCFHTRFETGDLHVHTCCSVMHNDKEFVVIPTVQIQDPDSKFYYPSQPLNTTLNLGDIVFALESKKKKLFRQMKKSKESELNFAASYEGYRFIFENKLIFISYTAFHLCFKKIT